MARHRPLEETVEAAVNPEARCPCVLLLDTSGSMAGERLDALTHGLFTFRAAITGDPLTASRVEVAVVTFDTTVSVVHPFTSAMGFAPPVLTATGETHMAAGIDTALSLVSSRKAFYKRQGLAHYRPWVFMITDGKPEGEPESAITQAAARLRAFEEANRVTFFAIGVANADMRRLEQISVRPPMALRGLEFEELFLWLSASMQSVSQSMPGEEVELPRPDSWLKQAAEFAGRHKDAIDHTLALARIGLKIVIGV